MPQIKQQNKNTKKKETLMYSMFAGKKWGKKWKKIKLKTNRRGNILMPISDLIKRFSCQQLLPL